jgi:dihydropyrimidinase
MTPFDWVIRGARVATAGGVVDCAVGIRDGRIAALADTLPDGLRTFDAGGGWLLPGGIDAHCHVDQPKNEGSAARGAEMADDFRSATLSAAFGGTTTIIPFAPQFKGQSLEEAVTTYHARAEGKTYADYGFHLILTDPTPDVLERELPDLAARGYTSVKVYMTYEAMRLSDRQILDVLAACKSAGVMTMIHAENLECIQWLTERLEAAGRIEPAAHALSRPPMVEREATHRAITLAEVVDAPLLVVHVSGREAIEEIARAQARGLPIHAETCPQYLFLSDLDLAAPDFEGAKCMCSPPPRAPGNQQHVWRGIENGTLSVFSSDHAPYRFDESGKLKYGRKVSFRFVANGIPGLETRLPLLFSAGVMTGRISLEHFVAITAANPARLYGLWPRKGTIAVGSDADLALWDPARKLKITNAMLHHNVDYTPYAGTEVHGWPTHVWSRGELICADGALQAEPGRGQFLRRDKAGAAARRRA